MAARRTSKRLPTPAPSPTVARAPDQFDRPIPITGLGAVFYPPKANSGGDRVTLDAFSGYAGPEPSARPDDIPAPRTPPTPPTPGDLFVIRGADGGYYAGPYVLDHLHERTQGLCYYPGRGSGLHCIANEYGTGRLQWQYADDVADAVFVAERAALQSHDRAVNPPTNADYADMLASDPDDMSAADAGAERDTCAR